MKKYVFLLYLLICFVAVGCGANKSLTGTVTFTDGEPATNGMVILRTDTFMARGEIQPDGSYRISSERERDGVPPGVYQVYVSGISEPLPPGAGAAMPTPLVDPKFENPDTSGLEVTIPAPRNRFDIVVERRAN